MLISREMMKAGILEEMIEDTMETLEVGVISEHIVHTLH